MWWTIGGKFRAHRKVRLDARAEDDEVECKSAGFGFHLGNA